jgi:hypothetical protein
MPATPPEAELTALNREIEQLEAELAVLEEQRAKRSKAVFRGVWRLRYLRTALRMRTIANKWQQGRLVLLVVLPIIVGVLALIVVDAITGWLGVASLCLLLGAGGTAAVLYFLFNRPADDLLHAAINEAESQSRVANAHFGEAYERLTEVKTRLERLIEERRAKMASGRVQRAALLQRTWKTMKAAEWEDFVVEVCRTLGATAERRARLDNGAELMVDFGSRRVATIVTTSREPIDSAAVRDAIALREREGCDTSAIITNGRFTGAAQDYAPRNGCKLIGRGEFPDFVLGQIEW